ncbi:hypothetical protein [Subtercola sp. YIM 133946]|uniref:hypothetical protein n=1 Tax=Subtercola sp. YIM 133946 TaxID=3118909 RepID=UPI002F9469B6
MSLAAEPLHPDAQPPSPGGPPPSLLRHTDAEVVGESWVVRVGSWVVGLLLGVVFGMVGTVVNQATVSVFGWFTLPIGLIMACLASILLLVGLRLVLPTRTLALLAAIGLVGIVAALTLQSPGGSVLIPANAYGYVWTFAPTVIALVVLAWPAVKRPPVRVDSSSE